MEERLLLTPSQAARIRSFMEEKLLFTRAESARILSISLRTLDSMAARKEIATRKVGRKVLIHRDALELFARRDHATREATL